MTASKAQPGVHVIKISLSEMRPEIWRRVAVPSHFTLKRLHKVIQIAMPWTGSHAHEFVIKGTRYSYPIEKGDNSGTKDDGKIDLQSVLPHIGNRAEYIYDLGDYWKHEIVVEKIPRATEGKKYPCCLAGERACPPDDCGGPQGFFDYLESTKVIGHPNRQEMLEWERNFDPKRFDLAEVNARLRKIR